MVPLLLESSSIRKQILSLIKEFGSDKKSLIKEKTLIPFEKRELTLSERIAKNLNTYGPQHHIRLSHSHLVPGAMQKQQGSCRPCRFIWHVDKKPYKMLSAWIEYQYTVSKKETENMPQDQKERLVRVSVRVMGTPDPNNLYVVAKDVCLLIRIRKGNVAKAISQFDDAEKARMPVLCCRTNGVYSTHVLTVLTVRGVDRLLRTSQARRAQNVHEWIMNHLQSICSVRLYSSSGTDSTTSTSSKTEFASKHDDSPEPIQESEDDSDTSSEGDGSSKRTSPKLEPLPNPPEETVFAQTGSLTDASFAQTSSLSSDRQSLGTRVSIPPFFSPSSSTSVQYSPHTSLSTSLSTPGFSTDATGAIFSAPANLASMVPISYPQPILSSSSTYPPVPSSFPLYGAPSFSSLPTPYNLSEPLPFVQPQGPTGSVFPSTPLILTNASTSPMSGEASSSLMDVDTAPPTSGPIADLES
jgi:prophage antirepressor-like protein